MNTEKAAADAVMQSPLSLAFVGDAVYSLAVRRRLADEGRYSVGDMHNMAARLVSAPYQAHAAEKILPLLSEREAAVFRRGRNAHTAHMPKGATVAEYHAATGLECLMGYLYLAGETSRAEELIHIIFDA